MEFPILFGDHYSTLRETEAKSCVAGITKVSGRFKVLSAFFPISQRAHFSHNCAISAKFKVRSKILSETLAAEHSRRTEFNSFFRGIFLLLIENKII